jgi:ABC-2 type transport system ATP-binding protein
MSVSGISVRGLRKSYGEHEVVRGIDIEVRSGEIFAFLGPNGAGKTTTVEILEGYRSRNAGEVSVLGEDPATADSRWRSRIGLVLQSCTMPAELTVSELVELYAGYYPRPRFAAETIELVGLTEQRDARTRALSGGQLRRLDVALALIGDPELVFLDEPTTGFDPSARHHAWEVIANLRDLGKTIFLTTHYMDEAQALADRVAVIAAGEIVAEGTPETLGDRDRAMSDIAFALPVGAALSELPGELTASARLREDGRVHINVLEPARSLYVLTGWALERGSHLGDLTVGRPTLEDVYLKLIDAQEDS